VEAAVSKGVLFGVKMVLPAGGGGRRGELFKRRS